MANWMQGTLVEKKQWCPDLISLKISSKALKFKAGQFVVVALDVDNELIRRPYSLVNTPDDSLLELHFNTVSGGDFSPALANLAIGDSIQVSERASGLLTLDQVPDVANLWLMATGTGIGPFLSILNTAEPWQRFDKIILCYCVKTAKDMAYRADFEALQSRYPEQFCFIPFITREQITDTINSRITTYLDSGELEKHAAVALSAQSSHIMLCGNANMLEEVSTLLENKGLRRHSHRDPGQIATEKYY